MLVLAPQVQHGLDGLDGASPWANVLVIGPPGEGAGCDAWAQTCPLGQKCAAWDGSGDGLLDDARCLEASGTAAAGEPCSAPLGGLDGADSCAAGYRCWNLDAAGEGVCLALCGGSPAAPVCAAEHVCVPEGPQVNLCRPRCDPLAPACPGDRVLCDRVYLWFGHDFLCAPDPDGLAGAPGDPCAGAGACAAGSVCAAAEQLAGCEAAGCCSPYCDHTQANACPGAPLETCVPYFQAGAAPPGRELLGVCRIAG